VVVAEHLIILAAIRLGLVDLEVAELVEHTTIVLLQVMALLTLAAVEAAQAELALHPTAVLE